MNWLTLKWKKSVNGRTIPLLNSNKDGIKTVGLLTDLFKLTILNSTFWQSVKALAAQNVIRNYTIFIYLFIQNFNAGMSKRNLPVLQPSWASCCQGQNRVFSKASGNSGERRSESPFGLRLSRLGFRQPCCHINTSNLGEASLLLLLSHKQFGKPGKHRRRRKHYLCTC